MRQLQVSATFPSISPDAVDEFKQTAAKDAESHAQEYAPRS